MIWSLLIAYAIYLYKKDSLGAGLVTILGYSFAFILSWLTIVYLLSIVYFVFMVLALFAGIHPII